MIGSSSSEDEVDRLPMTQQFSIATKRGKVGNILQSSSEDNLLEQKESHQPYSSSSQVCREKIASRVNDSGDNMTRLKPSRQSKQSLPAPNDTEIDFNFLVDDLWVDDTDFSKPDTKLDRKTCLGNTHIQPTVKDLNERNCTQKLDVEIDKRHKECSTSSSVSKPLISLSREERLKRQKEAQEKFRQKHKASEISSTQTFEVTNQPDDLRITRSKLVSNFIYL